MESTLNQPDFMDWLFPKPVNPKLHGIPDYELANPKLKVQDYLKFKWEPWNCGYNQINFLVRMAEQVDRADWKIERFKSQKSFRARLGDNPVSQAQMAQQIENGTRKPAHACRKEIRTLTTYERMAEIVSAWMAGRRERLKFLKKLQDKPDRIERYVRRHLLQLSKLAAIMSGEPVMISFSYSPSLIVEHFKSYFAEELAYLPT